MATTDDSSDTLWNQSVCSKSWVELVEEEEDRLSKSNGSIVNFNSPLLRDSTNTKHSSESRLPIKEEPIEDESACDISLNNETKDIKIQPSDVLPNFSVSHVRSTVASDSIKENASSVSRPAEPQKDFLQDDLSLTSHLNGFQLVSPCKVDHKTPTKTSSKTSVSHFLSQKDRSERGSSPSQLTKRKLQTDEPKSGLTDEMLMPSPSKIRRQHTPKQESHTPKRSTPNLKLTPNNRKRSRELTPGKSAEKKTPRDIESDPEVLARRQKQIDYGKNTIGYDRYRQLVPKESRSKMHPRTPPLHLKFSRRAWDGLIKVWRQRLHFWDPPSEGGGNPQSLEIGSDMSDTSSTEGSLPNTPIQERKRQCWVRTPKTVSGTPKSTGPAQPDEDDENQGCTPLPPED